MNINIPTQAEIVAAYSNFTVDSEEGLTQRTQELEKLNKAELVELIISKEKEKRTDTVQELAKAILKDPELIAADYEMIASAIREIKPEAKTSSKSIASYVSKKRDEWDLPQRIRITKARAPKEEAEEEVPETEEV